MNDTAAENKKKSPSVTGPQYTMFEWIYHIPDGLKLFLSLILDLIGASSLLFPALVSWIADIPYGPIISIFIWGAYRNLGLAIFATGEQWVPDIPWLPIDVIPTATISYIIYKIKKDKLKNARDVQLLNETTLNDGASQHANDAPQRSNVEVIDNVDKVPPSSDAR